MKRLLLLTLLTQNIFPAGIKLGNRNRMPAPINHHIDALKAWIPNGYVRLGLCGVAAALAATDNPIRKEFFNKVRTIQKVFNNMNQVTNEAHLLEINCRRWYETFRRVA